MSALTYLHIYNLYHNQILECSFATPDLILIPILKEKIVPAKINI